MIGVSLDSSNRCDVQLFTCSKALGYLGALLSDPDKERLYTIKRLAEVDQAPRRGQRFDPSSKACRLGDLQTQLRLSIM